MSQSWETVVFRRHWWLDAVAPGAWGETTVERDGRTCGHLPYAVRRLPMGGVALVSPPLTPWLGPWVADDARNRHEVMTELIDQLPRFDYFSETFDPQVVDWLPFHWRGFTATTRYTYRLSDISDPDKVWVGMTDKTRNVIRRAQREIEVRDDLPFEYLLRMLGGTFERQGLQMPFDQALLHRLHDAVLRNANGRLLFGVDASRAVHAAAMLVWDDQWTYYLLGGSDATLRRSGAGTLVLWEAIKLASTVSRGFDFEGSMLVGVERFFRSFGARQAPYFAVHKASRRMRVALAARELARAMGGRP